MRRLIAALVGAVSTSLAGAAPPPPAPQSLGQGVWLIPGDFLPNRQPDGNTVLFEGPKGLVVFDTGRHPWHRAAILQLAGARRAPVFAIVNSHWHLDHVSGNPQLKRAYPAAKVYASGAIDAALTGFLARSARSAREALDAGKLTAETAEDVRSDLATFENGSALRPDVIVSRSQALDLGGRDLRVNLAVDAATAGDLWLYDPKSGTVAVGDLVTLPVPFLDTACPDGWRAALAEVAATPFVRLIPGHGPPMDRAAFETYRRAFDAFIDCARSARAQAECTDGWTRDAASLLRRDDASSKRARRMAEYYVDLLRRSGGKSADCKAA